MVTMGRSFQASNMALQTVPVQFRITMHHSLAVLHMTNLLELPCGAVHLRPTWTVALGDQAAVTKRHSLQVMP